MKMKMDMFEKISMYFLINGWDNKLNFLIHFINNYILASIHFMSLGVLLYL
jgi:hypothetical protein